ncbi:hypothetical protein GIB67_009952 [Kingdonia uniflora]|uniref:Uncharacterized protein n=1 Tax=Kingdonia uniflora TaxID=39325 RepID=A0A7J7P2V0_9MAGN|nr:hypothetical protein GIB67_009952 [Kingdonia uniflora]
MKTKHIKSILPYFKPKTTHFKFDLYFGTENTNERVVCVKNLSPEDVLLHATRLRNALGRKVVKLRIMHIIKHPSVQGTWTANMKF